MVENFDNLIKQKQAELESLKPQMEEIRRQFTLDSAKFVSEWYKKTTEIYIERDADKTINLGKEKLGKMKAKVLKLVESAEAIIDEIFSNQKLWWHLVEDDNFFYSYYGNRAPDILDKPIRLALGKLGVILEEFGYVKTKSTGSREHDVWSEWDPSGNYHLSDGRPYYPYSVDWSETMQNTIMRYNELHGQAKRIRQEIDNLRREKKKHQAKNLWDSIQRDQG